MRVLRFALLAFLVLSLPVSGSEAVKKADQTKAADNAKQILGVWELVKADDIPKGATGSAEFTKDGKIKFNLEFMGNKVTAEGTYKVDGDKLTTTLKGPDGKEKTETDKIKTLNATTLLLVDDKGKIAEFKRKK
jgi:uncharacterized protein (TIGR03066 family)